MGETSPLALSQARRRRAFSILERIELGETPMDVAPGIVPAHLSVSSNGSNWVKPSVWASVASVASAFSILERIELGETRRNTRARHHPRRSFSILERIELGETRS